MQSIEEIQQQMADIRRDLPSDVEEVVGRARTLADWKYYVRTYPWMSVAAALAVGYLVVPAKKKPKQQADLPRRHEAEAGHGSTLSERLIEALARAAVAAATGVVTHQLNRFLGDDNGSARK